MRFQVSHAAMAVAFIAAGSASAAETQLPTVVVTANRQPTRVDRVLADVTVLSREDIASSGQSSLEQLLAAQPGVEYSSTGGAGQPANIFLRGGNGNHTLVLLDGMRINSATLGAAAISSIPLAAIDRVEILRGPASSLYGADAIGGVIQIFTRQGEGAPHITASYGVGNRNTSAVDFAAGGRVGDFSLALNGSRQYTDSVSSISHPDSRWGPFEPYNSDKDGFHNESLNAQARYRVAAGHELGVTASRFWGLVKKDATQCDVTFFLCTANFDSRSAQVVESAGAFWSAQLSDTWTSTLRFDRSVDDMRDYRFDPATLLEPRDTFKTVQRQIGWQNDVRVGQGTVLLAAEKVDQTIDSNSTYVAKERSIHSVLAGYSAWYGAHGVQANLRRDSNDQFGSKTTGGFTYAYQWSPAWRTQGGVKTAFKAPSFNDLYFPRDPLFGGGNPNVRPERSRAVELGASYAQGDHRVKLALYRNSVTDLIEWRPDLTVGPLFWTPQNVSKALLRGATLTYDGIIADWCVTSSLDLQNPIDVQRGDLLNNRARSLAKVQVSRRLGAWNLGVGATASGVRYENDPFGSSTRYRLGGYTLANASVEYDIDRSLSVFGRATNLFDKRYETRVNYGTEGAGVFIGLRYSMQ